jgi:hypothetical protein
MCTPLKGRGQITARADRNSMIFSMVQFAVLLYLADFHYITWNIAGRKENSVSYAVVLNPSQQIKMAAVIELWATVHGQLITIRLQLKKTRHVVLEASDV